MTLDAGAMLEKDLASIFVKRFKEWPIWTPNNRTAGWPDRGIQITKSRLIWFELKVLAERTRDVDVIRVGNLDPAQAAWLAKWQRAGGYCHVLVGLTEFGQRHFSRYVIVTVYDWTLWTKVPHQPIALNQLTVCQTMDDVYLWFRDRYIIQSPLNKSLAIGEFTSRPLSRTVLSR